jgi:hypothetical protein
MNARLVTGPEKYLVAAFDPSRYAHFDESAAGADFDRRAVAERSR